MKIRHGSVLKLAGVLMALAAAPASATFIELTPNASGVVGYTSGAFGGDAFHSRPLTSIRGYQISLGTLVQYSQYIIFDTTGLGFTPQYGALEFEATDVLGGFAGPGPLELWGLETYTPSDLIALPTGDLDSQLSLVTSISSDLRGGTVLAPTQEGADGPVRFKLNAIALNQISLSGGLWGLGIYDNRFGAQLGGIDLLNTPTLTLSDEPLAVPEPSTPALLLLALVALATRLRMS